MVLNDSGRHRLQPQRQELPGHRARSSPTTGDWVLFHYFNEGTQIHPMHLHQFDQIVIAKDGYPLDQPYVADTLNVAPGERYSVLVQLDKPGTWVWHCHILPHVEDERRDVRHGHRRGRQVAAATDRRQASAAVVASTRRTIDRQARSSGAREHWA